MTAVVVLSGVSPDCIRIDGIYRRKTPRGLTSARAPPVRPRGIFRLSKVKSVGFEIGKRLEASVQSTDVSVRPFEGFLFLCGGAITSSDETLASARHYALSRVDAEGRIAGHKAILAEKLLNLLEGGDYRDLLEFEEHVAALCACVLIFVESPGSIAELGSFSVMRHLSPKLVAVCEQRFESSGSRSFIFLGPLASLRRKRETSVQIFPIANNSASGAMVPDRALLDDCWQYIEEAILDSLRNAIPEATLSADELPHRMVMVASIIDLSVAIKIGELEETLARFGIEVREKALRRILRILEQFSLIEERTYGHEHFYHSKLTRPLITLKPSAEAPTKIFDYVRFKADAISHYAKSDDRRAKAIRAFLRSPLV